MYMKEIQREERKSMQVILVYGRTPKNRKMQNFKVVERHIWLDWHQSLTALCGSSGQFVESLSDVSSELWSVVGNEGVKSNDSLSIDVASLYKEACEEGSEEVLTSSIIFFSWSTVSPTDTISSSLIASWWSSCIGSQLCFWVTVLNVSNAAELFIISLLLGLW